MSKKKSDLILTLSGDDIDDDTIYQYKIDLYRILEENLENGQVPESTYDQKQGSKGDPITIGTIILSMISTGTMAAVVKSLKGILAREEHLRINVKNEDREINIDAKNIHDEKTMKLLERLFR